MLLGQSIFQSVLTRLDDERSEAEEAAPAAGFSVRSLGAAFVTPEGRPAASTVDTRAYLDHAVEVLDPGSPADHPTSVEGCAAGRAQEPVPPVMPSHLARLSEAEIAEDLAICAADGETVLNEKRRQFARLNHPDMVPPPFRDNATARMKIANRLIDRALASRG